MLTAERLRELFIYDLDTGIFTRRVRTSNSTKIGEKVGCLRNDGYLCARVDGELYLVHRLAWLYVMGRWTSEEIDHKNGMKNDNSWDNLREATKSVNQQNRHRPGENNTTGLLGVSVDRENKCFQVVITVDGKQIHVGRYKTATEAHRYYLIAKRKLHEGNTL